MRLSSHVSSTRVIREPHEFLPLPSQSTSVRPRQPREPSSAPASLADTSALRLFSSPLLFGYQLLSETLGRQIIESEIVLAEKISHLPKSSY
mmetsp:Transcript_28467/g.64553  ORF Transcript_28467/g.64553 Transcript_28467/m.64553 type:complete len:92 (+) Transcript_28467:109-384(+)